MNIRKCSFTILLAGLISQGNLFACEEDFNEPQELAQLIDANKWGEPNNGFVTQLIPRSKEFVLGKPMIFGLVMKNVSDSVKQYKPQHAYMNPVLILDANDNKIYYKKGPFQTIDIPEKPIDIGEVVTLFDNLNITEDYAITEPGKYTIRYRGPSYNIIEFEVKSGMPDQEDLLVSLLVNILPDKSWRVTSLKRQNISEEQKEESFAVVLSRGGKMDHIGVWLWQTKTQGAINDPRQNPPPYKYLGKNESGYFYVSIPNKALDYWPKIKEDIIKALNLES